MNKGHGIESKAESIMIIIYLMIFLLDSVTQKSELDLLNGTIGREKKRVERCGPHKASDIKAVKSKCPCSINIYSTLLYLIFKFSQ